MKTVNEIFDFLNILAPTSLKMDFDNVGFLVGSRNKVVKNCLIALDITDTVIDEAAELGAELIVSHHPIIFHELKRVTDDDITGRRIIKLIENDIAAICMHTNLDIADGGVNNALMKALGGAAEGFLEPCGEDINGNKVGCGRVGELKEEMSLPDFLAVCKSTLHSDGLRYHDAGLPVKRLAVMGGSGGDCTALAKNLGCDTYVTSDIKYNEFLDASELGINLIDADHFCTENVVVPVLYEKLCAEFPDVSFFVSEKHRQTARFF